MNVGGHRELPTAGQQRLPGDGHDTHGGWLAVRRGGLRNARIDVPICAGNPQVWARVQLAPGSAITTGMSRLVLLWYAP